MLVNLTAHPTLAIRLLCPPPELAERVPQLLSEVRSAVGSQGLRVAGSAYTRYLEHRPEEGVFALEVGLPTDRAGSSDGPIVASELPGGPAVLIWHDGPYATLGASHARLAELVRSSGGSQAGGPWESYVVGPEMEGDASRWKTVLIQPLVAEEASQS